MFSTKATQKIIAGRLVPDGQSKGLTKALLALGSLIILMAVSTRLVKAFNPQPDPPGIWGMIGITPSDTMRINVVNMEFSGIPPGPCNVALKFLDGQGKVLKVENIVVKPTQAASLDLTGVEAGASFRTEAHPVLISSTSNSVGCSAVGSVEVFNTTTGETSLFANPIFIPAPSAAQ